MKKIDVIQGSDQWLAMRAKFHTASEAPVMMGVSTKATRADLVRIKAGGSEREFSEWVQKNLLDKGHEIEAAARPIAEGIVGGDLYPETAVDDGDYLLASFDGLTMDERTGWECKSWNEEKAAAVREGHVPSEDYWQVVQQLVISGADRWLYMVTDGTPEKCVYTWFAIDSFDAEDLMAGWRQLDADVAGYQHVEPAPAPVAEAIVALPALTLQIEGRVVTSNLVAFKQSAEDFIAGIKTDLKTDDDFATAEKTVKFCKEAEDRLELVKKQALAQTATIDEVYRTIDAIRDGFKSKRLSLGKSVDQRKEAIRFEILQEGRDALAAHIAELNKAIGKPYMPTIAADFAGVMKGKKTIASLRDAVAGELARAKIEADAIANRIQINLNSLRELAADHTFLFADTAQIVMKANDDLVMLIRTRIADHRVAEEAKLEAARKAEAERIERQRQAEAERIERERQAAQSAIASPAPANPPPEPAAQPAPAASSLRLDETVAAAGHASPTAQVTDLFGTAPKQTRPTDEQIIDALALHFRVHESKVIEWLLDVDLNAASARMTRQFA